MQLNRENIMHVFENDAKDIGLEIDDTIKEMDKLKMVINMT